MQAHKTSGVLPSATLVRPGIHERRPNIIPERDLHTAARSSSQSRTPSSTKVLSEATCRARKHETRGALRPRVSVADQWSGRLDLNQRPQDPQSCALPGCATPRLNPINCLDTGFYHPGARCTVKCARELAGGLLEIRVTDDRVAAITGLRAVAVSFIATERGTHAFHRARASVPRP